MNSIRFLALLPLITANFAFAQTKAKDGATKPSSPTPSASAPAAGAKTSTAGTGTNAPATDASVSAPPPPSDTAPPPPPPRAGDEKKETTPPPAPERDPGDPYESPSRVYHFIGARYRGTYIPQFMLNIAVREGASVYSNSIGIEYERRTDGFSIIPALTYTEYGTGDMLFLEKGKPETVIGNWVAVNSSMKALYASVDLLWSKKISSKVSFEYGFGVGIGAFFDSLMVNWVKDDPNGALTASNGRRFSLCQTVTDGPGCTARDHSNSQENKVGRYEEKSWFNGGSKPVLLPTITVPNLGIRWKPHRAFASRVQLGFSTTGFWFGISGSYGFPGKPAAPSPKAVDAVEVEETIE